MFVLNVIESFTSKLFQVYTQANKHGEVAKIQPPWKDIISSGSIYRQTCPIHIGTPKNFVRFP